jgi:hypothetical protein
MDERNHYDVITSFLSDVLSSYFTGVELESNNTIIDDTDYTNNPALPKESEEQAIVVVNKHSELDSQITETDCPICLESLNNKNYVNLRCKDNAIHRYHESCLTMTLNALEPSIDLFYCPLCRYQHNYQIEKRGDYQYMSIGFSEYWFWKSIIMYNVFENFILCPWYLCYLIIVYNRLNNKYNNKFETINIPLIFGNLLHIVTCLDIPVRKIIYLIKNCSTNKVINNKHLFIWLNYPILVYLVSYIHLTTYFLINYLINTNKTISIILIFSSLPMSIIMMSLTMYFINNKLLNNKYRTDGTLKYCQKFSNLFKKFRKTKKELFSSTVRIYNSRQDFRIKTDI